MNQNFADDAAWMKTVPVGQMFFKNLLDYCIQQGDQAESYALEIKGADVDPTSKVGGAKIAKFVLGAANRDPEQAKETFAGYAIMLIGLGDGAADGIEQVEVLNINNVVEKYFGDQALKWDVEWINLPDNSSKKILAVIVAPPSYGNPIYVSFSDGEGIDDGGIYVRSLGETRKAKGIDLSKLQKRAIQVVETEVPFNLEIKLQCNHFTELQEATDLVRSYVQKRSNYLISLLPSKKRNPMGFDIGAISLFGEERTEEQYLIEIQDWEEKALSQIGARTEQALRAFFPPLTISLNNNSDLFVRGLEVELSVQFPPGVLILEREYGRSQREAIEDTFPEEPKPWGEANSLIPSLSSIYNPSTLSHGLSSVRTLTRSFEWDQEKRVGKLWLKELRPKASIELQFDEFFFLANGVDVDGAIIPWKATMEGRNRQYEGNATICSQGSNALAELSAALV
ncbi:hypothetical protein [Propionimicrobium lymphophilum]|uniref:hypothetical protein n=1 Tax=Propionimicrobium lymphophilum TaxID=33012 RepID=UPI0023F123AE|nr:hypothetical protein [Propionimicrobium lymphophilum]